MSGNMKSFGSIGVITQRSTSYLLFLLKVLVGEVLHALGIVGKSGRSECFDYTSFRSARFG